jgi:hypothetical protein
MLDVARVKLGELGVEVARLGIWVWPGVVRRQANPERVFR